MNVSNRPVNDAVYVKEHQCQRHFSSIETGPWLVKLAGPLYLEHQVPTVDVLHDEKQPLLRNREHRLT